MAYHFYLQLLEDLYSSVLYYVDAGVLCFVIGSKLSLLEVALDPSFTITIRYVLATLLKRFIIELIIQLPVGVYRSGVWLC